MASGKVTDPVVTPRRALCKLRGALVIMEISECAEGHTGACPECGSKSFSEHYGWTECDGDCEFAVLSSDIVGDTDDQ